MVDADLDVIEIIDLESDFLYTPISCRGRTKNDAISVEKYAESKELKAAIRASILQSKQVIDLSGFQEQQNPLFSKTEHGEPSNSKSSEVLSLSFICEICAEPKSQNESFSIKGCTHYFCSDCMVRYVATKIQENITSIRCPEPNCQGVLEPQFCRSILPQKVFDRWSDALCEALILGSERFYCPYQDCSALLVDDGGSVVKDCECPYCYRLFCAQCKVPWHGGIECGEFQRLRKDERGRDDIMVMELARKEKWQRCSVCRFYVERTQGCLYMKCRCGHAFCYSCGASMKDHYCVKCRR